MAIIWFLLGATIGVGAGLLLCRRGRRALAARQRANLLVELQGVDLPLLVIAMPEGTVHASAALLRRAGVPPGRIPTLEALVTGHVDPADQPRLRALVAELVAGRRLYGEANLQVLLPGARWRQADVQLLRVADGPAGRCLLVGSVNDPARAHEVEEERDRLFNLSLDLLAIGDLNGRLLQVNPAWVRVLHWSRDEIMEVSFPDLIHPDDRAAALAAAEELRAGQPVRDLELRTLCRDGSHRWIAWSSFPLTARRTVFTVARDITERKAADAKLRRYQRRLQLLASQLATVEETQQRRLAEILHDTLAQEIFAAQAKLSLLRYPERLGDAAAVVQDVASILDHASALTRSLTFELFPPSLYEVGLDAALEWLCRSFSRTRGLVCGFRCDGETIDLPHEVRTLFYQGARELLANVYKHAGATGAEMQLRQSSQRLELQVDDDGRGFDLVDPPDGGEGSPDEERELGGFGLFNLRERLDRLGGSLDLGANERGGGRVTIMLPLDGGRG